LITKICIIFSSIGLLCGCSPVEKSKPNLNVGVKNEYPPRTKEMFLQACEKQTMGRHDFCECLFDKTQRKYTFEEFSTILKKLEIDETPEDYEAFGDQARAECLESSSHD
jgi:hypothetical protein